MRELIWKEVVGYEGLYEVSSTGQVRGMPKTVTGNHLKATRNIPARTKKQCLLLGYPAVTLFKDGIPKLVKVHRLVAEAFILRVDGCDIINHIDSDKTNNNVSNLEWTTPQGNVDHMIRHNRKVTVRGEQAGRSAKLTEQQALEIINLKGCLSQKALAELYGVGQVQVSRIQRGLRWPHLKRDNETDDCS